jgi:hypothetical protein
MLSIALYYRDCDGGCSSGEIAGAIIGAILGVMFLLLVIYVFAVFVNTATGYPDGWMYSTHQVTYVYDRPPTAHSSASPPTHPHTHTAVDQSNEEKKASHVIELAPTQSTTSITNTN